MTSFNVDLQVAVPGAAGKKAWVAGALKLDTAASPQRLAWTPAQANEGTGPWTEAFSRAHCEIKAGSSKKDAHVGFLKITWHATQQSRMLRMDLPVRDHLSAAHALPPAAGATGSAPVTVPATASASAPASAAASSFSGAAAASAASSSAAPSPHPPSIQDTLRQRARAYRSQLSEAQRKMLEANRLLSAEFDAVFGTDPVLTTPQEFFAARSDEAAVEATLQHQKRALPSSSLVNLEKKDGDTYEFTLTTDMMFRIFDLEPHVMQKYKELVESGQVSEAEFWTAYAWSNYEYGERRSKRKRLWHKEHVHDSDDESSENLFRTRGRKKQTDVVDVDEDKLRQHKRKAEIRRAKEGAAAFGRVEEHEIEVRRRGLARIQEAMRPNRASAPASSAGSEPSPADAFAYTVDPEVDLTLVASDIEGAVGAVSGLGREGYGIYNRGDIPDTVDSETQEIVHALGLKSKKQVAEVVDLMKSTSDPFLNEMNRRSTLIVHQGGRSDSVSKDADALRLKRLREESQDASTLHELEEGYLGREKHVPVLAPDAPLRGDDAASSHPTASPRAPSAKTAAVLESVRAEFRNSQWRANLESAVPAPDAARNAEGIFESWIRFAAESEPRNELLKVRLAEVLPELVADSLSVNDLLRHFWGAMTRRQTPALKEKVDGLVGRLEKWQSVLSEKRESVKALRGVSSDAADGIFEATLGQVSHALGKAAERGV